MKDQIYKHSLESFLAATNEKQAISDFVVDILKTKPVRNLLDIGAGDGQLAREILARVRCKNYTAVEVNKTLAEVLTSKLEGRVVIDEFPSVELKDNSYDAILSSYSLPIENDSVTKFLHDMARKLTKDGVGIVITYDVYSDGWSRLKKEISEIIDVYGLRGFDEQSLQTTSRSEIIRNILAEYGDVSEVRIDSMIRVGDITGFFEAIGFLLTAGDVRSLKILKDHEQDLLPIFKRYKQDDVYEVHMSHMGIVCKKADRL